MSLFEKIFGKKDDPVKADSKQSDDKPVQRFRETIEKRFAFDNSPESFKTELFNSSRRYYSGPELTIDINLTDTDGTIYKPHEAFNALYDQWKLIVSKWDRLSLFFHFWDDTDFNKLQKWQKLERYIKNREGLKALNFFQSNITTDDFIDIRVIIAVSKLHRILLMNDKAKYYISGAYQLRPDLDIVKAEYASVLHLSKSTADKDLAHQLINEIIKVKIEKSENQQIGLLDFFVFSKDYIDSSIFAISYLDAGNCTVQNWDILAEEYYYCPIFRYEHAVKLNKTGDTLSALAKMNSLSMEFPWFKKALTTTIDIINQFREKTNNPEFMKNELLRLKQNLSLNNSV